MTPEKRATARPEARRERSAEEIAAKPWAADILRAVDDSRKPAPPIEQGQSLPLSAGKSANRADGGPVAPQFDMQKHFASVSKKRAAEQHHRNMLQAESDSLASGIPNRGYDPGPDTLKAGLAIGDD